MPSVLIVGCGNIAGSFDAGRDASMPPLTHAGAFVRHGGFDVAACVEPVEERRLAFMQRFGVQRGYAHMADVLDEQGAGRFDVVSLCSPTAAHAPGLEQTLALRPRLVFCEQPVTPTVEQTERLVQRCKQVGMPLAVNHARRWASDVQALAAQLKAGEWGTVRSAVGTYNKGVLNSGGHLVDLLHLWLGPLRVLHAGQPVSDHWSDDPTVPAMLQSDSGVPVHLNTAHAADCAIFELQLYTERAVISMEDGGLQWRVRRVTGSAHFQNYRVFDSGERTAGDVLYAMRNAVHNLHQHLVRGLPLASTGATALAAQRVCEAIRHRATAPGLHSAGRSEAADDQGFSVQRTKEITSGQ